MSRIVVMDVDESSVAPEPAAPLPTTAQAIRFCRTCGEPWQPDWDSCPGCAERARSAQPAVEASRTYERDRKSIFSSVVLYFSLLAVSFVAVLIIAATGRDDSAFVEIGHSVPSRHPSPLLCDVERLVLTFLAAVGLCHGPGHTEVKLTSRGPVIVESHNRVGGDRINELVETAYDVDMDRYALGSRFGLVEPLQQSPPSRWPARRSASSHRRLDG